jgi:hypothetical protein
MGRIRSGVYRRPLAGVIRRLQDQYPDKTPLTIMGEIQRLKDAGYDVEVKDGLGNVVPTGPKRGKV